MAKDYEQTQNYQHVRNVDGISRMIIQTPYYQFFRRFDDCRRTLTEQFERYACYKRNQKSQQHQSNAKQPEHPKDNNR